MKYKSVRNKSVFDSKHNFLPSGLELLSLKPCEQSLKTTSGIRACEALNLSILNALYKKQTKVLRD